MTKQDSSDEAVNPKAAHGSAEKFVNRLDSVLSRYESRKQAASVAGVRAEMLTRYSKGQNAPGFDAIARLTAGVGISLDWLATGQGEMLLADRGEAAPESEDSNEVIKHRTLLFDMVVGMESQVQDSGLNPTPEQRANMILFMTDMMVDGKMPPMTPRLQKQMLKLIGR